MTAERLPATGRRQNFGKYIILGYDKEDLAYNIGSLQSIARQIDMEVFKVERDFAVQDVAFNLRNGGSMTIVADAETLEPVGYSSQRPLMPTLEGNRRRIMFTTTRAIKEEHQNEGIGPETLRFSFNMHGAPDIVAGIMGWAPPVVGYYKSGVVAEVEGYDRSIAEITLQKSKDKELDEINRQFALVKLYPIYRLHSQSPIMREALDYIIQTSRYRGTPYNQDSGLMKGLWDKDPTMLYRVEKASRRVEVVGQLLKDKFDLDTAGGDAIVVAGPKSGWRAFID